MSEQNQQASTSAREAILTRVKAGLAGLPKRATLPDWSVELAEARKLVEGKPDEQVFAERLRLVNGRSFTSVGEIGDALRAGGWTRGYCDPELVPLVQAGLGAGITLETSFDRTRIDDYQFGITRARAAVAETGSIMLDDATTSRRLAALTPWVHVAVVRKETIHRFLADAVLALPDDPNIILATGPSKTADVEGILIEGVHGPGQQWALLV